MSEPKNNWGGKRQGAGRRKRPPSKNPSVTVSCRVSYQTKTRYHIDSAWLQDAIEQKIKSLPDGSYPALNETKKW